MLSSSCAHGRCGPSAVEKGREANALIRDHCRTDNRLGYVDVDGPMLGWDEKPRKEFFVEDGLHLTPKGYAVWAALVRPFLEYAMLPRCGCRVRSPASCRQHPGPGTPPLFLPLELGGQT